MLNELSIITVNLNNVAGLVKTHESIKEFVKQNSCEWVVIDGGSKDGSVEFLSSLSGLEYTSEPDKGIYDAMNKGISKSKGKSLLFLNSGDIVSGNLSNLLLQAPFYFDSFYVSNGARKKRKYLPRFIGLPASHQSIVFKNNKLFYDDSYSICGDYDFFLRNDPMSFKYVPDINSVMEDGGVSSVISMKSVAERFRVRYRNGFRFFSVFAFCIESVKLLFKVIIRWIF